MHLHKINCDKNIHFNKIQNLLQIYLNDNGDGKIKITILFF